MMRAGENLATGYNGKHDRHKRDHSLSQTCAPAPVILCTWILLGGGVICKFHRQSSQCSAMEMEALQLHLFDVVDKKQG